MALGPNLQFLYFSLAATVLTLITASLLLSDTDRDNTTGDLVRSVKAFSSILIILASLGFLYSVVIGTFGETVNTVSGVELVDFRAAN